MWHATSLYTMATPTCERQFEQAKPAVDGPPCLLITTIRREQTSIDDRASVECSLLRSLAFTIFVVTSRQQCRIWKSRILGVRLVSSRKKTPRRVKPSHDDAPLRSHWLPNDHGKFDRCLQSQLLLLQGQRRLVTAGEGKLLA